MEMSLHLLKIKSKIIENYRKENVVVLRVDSLENLEEEVGLFESKKFIW